MLVENPGSLWHGDQSVVRSPDQRAGQLRPTALNVAPGHTFVANPRTVEVRKQTDVGEVRGHHRGNQFPPPLGTLRQVLTFSRGRIHEPRELPVGREHRVTHKGRCAHRVEDRAEQLVDQGGLFRGQAVARGGRERYDHGAVRPPTVGLPEHVGQQLAPGCRQVMRLIKHECVGLAAVEAVDHVAGVGVQSRHG